MEYIILLECVVGFILLGIATVLTRDCYIRSTEIKELEQRAKELYAELEFKNKLRGIK